MKRPCRIVVALFLLFALAALAGCGGRKGNAGSTWKDPNPLPVDTMSYAHGEVGTHGGRMVVAQTSAPRPAQRLPTPSPTRVASACRTYP